MDKYLAKNGIDISGLFTDRKGWTITGNDIVVKPLMAWIYLSN